MHCPPLSPCNDFLDGLYPCSCYQYPFTEYTGASCFMGAAARTPDRALSTSMPFCKTHVGKFSPIDLGKAAVSSRMADSWEPRRLLARGM